jgi:hypothetical protein
VASKVDLKTVAERRQSIIMMEVDRIFCGRSWPADFYDGQQCDLEFGSVIIRVVDLLMNFVA